MATGPPSKYMAGRAARRLEQERKTERENKSPSPLTGHGHWQPRVLSRRPDVTFVADLTVEPLNFACILTAGVRKPVHVTQSRSGLYDLLRLIRPSEPVLSVISSSKPQRVPKFITTLTSLAMLACPSWATYTGITCRRWSSPIPHTHFSATSTRPVAVVS